MKSSNANKIKGLKLNYEQNPRAKQKQKAKAFQIIFKGVVERVTKWMNLI